MAFEKDELALAAKVLKEVAGNPDSGVVAELIRDIESKASAPTKEVRVSEVKETR